MSRSQKRKSADRPSDIPQRYAVKEKDGRRVIQCSESPNIAVHVERGQTATESNARKAGPRTIYLDGAAQSPPFLDNERQIYNLDHHEGVVRAFTMATCEQALLLILRGMELAERNWDTYANEPDLDTALAIWLILNHKRIADKDARIAEKITPLVRLEGAIDALGLDMKRICGYSPDKRERLEATLNELREEELKIKKDGTWDEIDFAEYTVNLLHRIDRVVYRPMDFVEYRDLEELARVEVNKGNDVVFFRSEMGIYELEQYLTQLYGHPPGILVLQKNEKTYTLRQVDLFLPAQLDKIYERLNFQDPAVRSSDNLWGGSGDIGGSPRATGTRLRLNEIADAVRNVLQPPTIWGHVLNFFSATLLTGLVFIPAIFVARQVEYAGFLANFVDRWFYDSIQFYYPAALLVIVSLLYFLGGKRNRVFGFALPAGGDWAWLLPGVLLAGAFGGFWVPAGPAPDHLLGRLFAALCLPLAGEILFRGYLYGALARRYRCMHLGGEWFLSFPAIVTGLCYAFIALLLATDAPLVDALNDFSEWIARVDQLLHFAGAFCFALLAGMARERSGSLLVPLLFHLPGGVLLFFLRTAALI